MIQSQGKGAGTLPRERGHQECILPHPSEPRYNIHMTATKERTADVFPLAAFLRFLPENRVWVSGFEKQTFTGVPGWLSSTTRWGCGYRCDGITSGSTDQRFYASSYGRFNTADPYMASAGAADPGSWNRYSYVQGDPINYNDRSGNNRAFVDQNSSSGGCGDYQYWYFQLLSTDSFSNPCGGDGQAIFPWKWKLHLPRTVLIP